MSERCGIVARAAAVSFGARAVSVLASLASVPMVLHHVGAERFGIWMAALAVATVFTVADGGVAKGLIAQVAAAKGRGDRERVQVLVSTALAVTVAFVAVFASVMLAVVLAADWAWAFRLGSAELGAEAGAVVATVCLAHALSFVPTVLRETRLGLMEGARVYRWDLAGVVLGFVGLAVAVGAGSGIVVIAAVWAGGPVVMRTVGAVAFLAGAGRDLVPSFRAVDAATARALIAAGGVFVFYTLGQVFALQADQVVIARVWGAEAVAPYAIVQKLFAQPQVLVTLWLVAQWPAYGEALGRGDEAWISAQLRRTLLGVAVFAVFASGVLAVMCPAILRVWVGAEVEAPRGLVVAFAVHGVVAAVGSVVAFFYLSLGMHRRLVVAQAVMVGVSLPMMVVLVPAMGPMGAVVAMTVAWIAAYAGPGLWGLRRAVVEVA